jgi:hypothetical protein
MNQFEAANELKVVVFYSANPDFYIDTSISFAQVKPVLMLVPLVLEFYQTSCNVCPVFLSPVSPPSAAEQEVLESNS